ncbi:MAG TPA: hypothetical protein VKT73_11095 [Xanthobacteraceae bacterium]|nr:hypothetical protein [Xanthobacteraceae bacterium]
MTKIRIVATGFAAFALAALIPPAANAADLGVTPRAPMKRVAHACTCRGHAYEEVDWFYFTDCCYPTGHPRPKGFCGGKDFYFGGVW